jgi:hypothetical protein
MTSYIKVGDAVESGVAALMRARELFGTELSDAQMAQCVFKPDGAHPTRQAVQQVRQRLQPSGASASSSSSRSAGKRRAPVTVSETQGRDIGKVARRVKQRRGSVVAADVALRAKETCRNPVTGKPLCIRTIQRKMSEFGHDGDPGDPWDWRRRRAQTSLTAAQEAARLAYSDLLLTNPHHANASEPGWLKRFVVFFDPCSRMIPGNAAKFEQGQCGAGIMHWGSPGAALESINLKQSPFARQVSWGDDRYHFFIVVAKCMAFIMVPPKTIQRRSSKATIEMLEWFVRSLENRMRRHLPEDTPLPRVLFSDRGGPMYTQTGYATLRYRAVAAENGFRLLMGYDARMQPGALAEAWPHETIAAFVQELSGPTSKFAAAGPAESLCSFTARMQRVENWINKKHNVEGVVASFKARLEAIRAAKGGRVDW